VGNGSRHRAASWRVAETQNVVGAQMPGERGAVPVLGGLSRVTDGHFRGPRKQIEIPARYLSAIALGRWRGIVVQEQASRR